MQLSIDETQIIEELKTVSTGPEIARAVVKLLRVCGIYNHQGVAQEMARIWVTRDREGGN